MQRIAFRAILCCAAFGLGTGFATASQGDTPLEPFGLDVTVGTHHGQLLASDGMAEDQFGASIAISGDLALVGAPGQDDQGKDSGAAYVFERKNGAWTEIQKLVPKLGGAGAQFGASVALSGDVCVVGAKNSAYVFTRTGNSFVEQELVPSNGDTYGDNSTNVAIWGDTVVVGARLAAYAFVRNADTWMMQQKLVGPADAPAGISVAIFEQTLLASAIEESPPASGSVYVFIRNGGMWSQQAKLVAPKPVDYDGFGESLALTADFALIGAPRADRLSPNDTYNGVAYAFVRNQTAWSVQKEFRSDIDTNGQDDFGRIVALSPRICIFHGRLVRQFRNRRRFSPPTLWDG